MKQEQNRSVKCQACQRESQMFLCENCSITLENMLTGLTTGGTTTDEEGRERRIPGLLADLEDAATGQTRFAGKGRRSGSDEAPIRFNDRARTIINDIRMLLIGWAHQLAPQAGHYQPLDPNDTTAYALWLADHTHQLAGIDGAGQFHRALNAVTKRAQKCTDAPPKPRFCGQCDTKIERRMCGVNLYAHRDATQINCPNCHTTHNIEELFDRTLDASDHRTFTRDELIGKRSTDPTLCTTGIMGAINEHVSRVTFNRWTREGHLRPVQYLRPNGRHGINLRSADDIPKYRLSDVRNTKRRMAENEKSGKAKTR